MEHALNLLKNYLVHSRFRMTGEVIPAARSEWNSKAIAVTSGRVVGVLALIAFLLLFASLGSELGNFWTGAESRVFPKLVKAFSVDRELNVPAFFSMVMLLFSSSLLACMSLLSYDGRAASLRYWGVLSLGFLWMAFDEIASVHEKLIEPMRVVLGGENLGVFYFAWVVPGIIVALLCIGWFFRFWWNLPSKTRIQFFVAGALFLSGALGIELIDGSYAEIFGKKNVIYAVLSTAEEALEMAGVIVFIKALLDHIGERFRTISFRFTKTS